MTLLTYVYSHPTTPTPRKRKGWERALLPLSLFWKPRGGGGGVFGVGGCCHMAMNLQGGVGMDIFWNHKILDLSRYYIPFLHSHKQITFSHKGNKLRLGPTKYWSEICMKSSTHPWLVLLSMLTGEDGEKGLLLVCTWRHGGHVGGQEQKHFSPLGTKLYFHVNFSRKYSFVLTPNMAALSRGCKPRICHASWMVQCLLFKNVQHTVPKTSRT